MTTEPDEDQVPDVVDPNEVEVEDPGWPFGFITMLVLAGLYLIWRLTDLTIRFLRWAF